MQFWFKQYRYIGIICQYENNAWIFIEEQMISPFTVVHDLCNSRTDDVLDATSITECMQHISAVAGLSSRTLVPHIKIASQKFIASSGAHYEIIHSIYLTEVKIYNTAYTLIIYIDFGLPKKRIEISLYSDIIKQTSGCGGNIRRYGSWSRLLPFKVMHCSRSLYSFQIFQTVFAFALR